MGHMWHRIYYIPKPTLELKKIISGIEKDGLLTELAQIVVQIKLFGISADKFKFPYSTNLPNPDGQWFYDPSVGRRDHVIKPKLVDIWEIWGHHVDLIHPYTLPPVTPIH